MNAYKPLPSRNYPLNNPLFASFTLWIALCLLGNAPQVRADYPTGFQWVRSSDWLPGSLNDSLDGNPTPDSVGNPVWYYERCQGSDLASTVPWYSQPRSLQVWKEPGQRWHAKTIDGHPSESAEALEESDGIPFAYSPVVRWQNPSGRSLLVDIYTGTDVQCFREGGGSQELELAIVKLSGVYSVLWSTNRTVPNDGKLLPGPIVSLSSVSIEPGDAILFTYRNKQVQPQAGANHTAWFDAARIVVTEPTLTMVPAPHSILLSWSRHLSKLVLQECDDLAGTNWRSVGAPVVEGDRGLQATVPVSDTTGRTFYRLQGPPSIASRMPVPPRVWGTWNDFPIPIGSGWANSTNVNEVYIRTLCDWWSTNGMLQAGWKYIVLEENWQSGLDSDGRFIVKSASDKFPSGLRNLFSYIKSKGFIPGIYTSVSANHGGLTCEGFAGTCYTNLDIHFQQFADWGVEFVFIDNCMGYSGWKDVPNQDLGFDWDALLLQRLQLIHNAIEKTGKPIAFLNVIPPYLRNGFGPPASYAMQNISFPNPFATPDLWDFIPNTATVAEVVTRTYTNSLNGWYRYTRPGHYFYQGQLNTAAGNLDFKTFKIAFCLQSMTAGAMFTDSGFSHVASVGNSNSYFFLGPQANPPSSWNSPTFGKISTNREIAAIHQDPAVIPGSMIWSNNLVQLWWRPLGKKENSSEHALLLLNLSASNQVVTIPFHLFAPADSTFAIRDVITQSNVEGDFQNTVSMPVSATDCRMLRLTQVFKRP